MVEKKNSPLTNQIVLLKISRTNQLYCHWFQLQRLGGLERAKHRHPRLLPLLLALLSKPCPSPGAHARVPRLQLPAECEGRWYGLLWSGQDGQLHQATGDGNIAAATIVISMLFKIMKDVTRLEHTIQCCVYSCTSLLH